jgi:hypothetical protein
VAMLRLVHGALLLGQVRFGWIALRARELEGPNPFCVWERQGGVARPPHGATPPACAADDAVANALPPPRHNR